MATAAPQFLLQPPDWPVLFGAAAAGLLALWAVWIAIYLRRAAAAGGGQEPTARWLAMTALCLFPLGAAIAAALTAGPAAGFLAAASGLVVLGAIGVASAVGQSSAAGRTGRSSAAAMSWASLHSTVLGFLAAGALTSPLAGSIIAIAGGTIFWMVRSYSRTTAPVSRSAKACLLSLRIAAILLLAAWIMHPMIEYSRSRLVPQVLLLMVDTSSSMQRPDMPLDYRRTDMADDDRPKARRIDAVRQALADQAGRIDRLREHYEIAVVDYHARATHRAMAPSLDTSRASLPHDIFQPGDATGLSTAIGDSIAAAFDPYAAAGKKVAAVVVIGDGCNNTSDRIEPLDEAELMATRQVPLLTVGVGSETVTRSTRTLNLTQLQSADEIEAFNRLPITASIEAVGLAGRQIEAVCTFGGEVIGTEKFTATGQKYAHEWKLSHVPLAAGYHRLAVKVRCTGGPVANLAGQQAADKLVHVVDRELRILYVEGQLRYEAKYISQALGAAERFSIDRRLILEPMGGQQSPSLSENPQEWLKYHAIIIGDVPAGTFTPRQLEIIKDLVSNKGKGLCMIGGENSFGRGGWADSPLAGLIPVELDLSGEQIAAATTIVPSEIGLRHDLMDLGTPDVAAAWAQLPLAVGANKLGKPRLGASVLAATPQGDPLIVCHSPGAGRSLAIAFDTTWRWVLSPKDTAELQRRFWRQVALYLANPKGNIWVTTDKTNYDMQRLTVGADKGVITAGIEDASGRAIPQALREVSLTDPSGKTTAIALSPAADGGREFLSGRIPAPVATGTYVLNMKAQVDGKLLTAEHQYEVTQKDLESREVLANLSLLRKMAQASGGRYYTLGELGLMLDDISRSAGPIYGPDEPIVDDLSGRFRWPIVLCLIALLCAEWAIRKHKGLV